MLTAAALTVATALALTLPALPPIGTAFEQAVSAEDILVTATRIAAPGPPFTPLHLAQDVHQQKRQQHACNGLARLDRLLTGGGAAAERSRVVADPRTARLAACAAAPSGATPDGVDEKHDRACAVMVASALAALAALCAADAVERVQARAAATATGDDADGIAAAAAAKAAAAALAPLRAEAVTLTRRADALEPRMTPRDAAAACWSARRLLGAGCAAREAPALEAALERAALPFDLLPCLCALPPPDRSEIAEAVAGEIAGSGLPSVAALVATHLLVGPMERQIPFARQELMTADGKKVQERRHTAWLAESGIGALAYSGKLMAPAPLAASDGVAAVREALEADTAERFDCVLCNLYPAGGEAACKWHSDPEHGSRWALPTSVVTVGEPRRFSFRPTGGGGGDGMRHVFPLFAGDVVAMRGACQDEFEHAVLPGVGELNAGPRVSLVFKRALVAADGRRGHGLQGEGRRARARARQQASESDDGSAHTAAAPAKQGAAPAKRAAAPGAANRKAGAAKAAGAARSRGRRQPAAAAARQQPRAPQRRTQR
jgi:alkylated DNA repair dioxygenase AlkB